MTEARKPKKTIQKSSYEPEVQDPLIRQKNFNEIIKGFTLEAVKQEAERCLQCAKPKCVEGCRVHANIPKVIRLVREEKFKEAYETIKKYNPIPAVTCRVCPQEKQCEGNCVLGKKWDPIAIGLIERFVIDQMRQSGIYYEPIQRNYNKNRVAIIGSGPAGLVVAKELLPYGYDLTIFEAFHKGGGVLAYGIPEYRLPKDIVKDEVKFLKFQGVKFNYNTKIGRDFTIDDLFRMGYDAIFIGIGVCKPMKLRMDGEDLENIIDAQEYLKSVNMVKSYGYSESLYPIPRGKNVTVIGGGNVAMDAARTARRLGSETVTIVYRRALEQVPACKKEIEDAKEEDVIFQFLTNPKKFIGDENGKVIEMEVMQMRLGEPDASGRASPIPIENSEYKIPTDLVIIAIGNEAASELTSSCTELKVGRWGNIEVDKFGKTNIKGIYAGGDIVTGADTVASAIVAGKAAAKDIHRYLVKKEAEAIQKCINYFYMDSVISVFS
jgi:glutamate synthase (NADPH/NADH) small chain